MLQEHFFDKVAQAPPFAPPLCSASNSSTTKSTRNHLQAFFDLPNELRPDLRNSDWLFSSGTEAAKQMQVTGKYLSQNPQNHSLSIVYMGQHGW